MTECPDHPWTRLERWLESRHALVLSLLVIAAAAPRIAGMFTEFWIDEIWSLLIVAEAHSWSDLLFGQNHDNNHRLNSVLMAMAGVDQPWPVYRISTVGFGVATVWLISRDSVPGREIESLTAGVLTASSFLMVLYATEARGYAGLMCFSLVAYLAIGRHKASGSDKSALVANLAGIVALLFHFTYIYVYLALLVRALGSHLSTGSSLKTLATEFLRLHAAPGVVALALGIQLTFFSTLGGGPTVAPSQTLQEALSLLFGIQASDELFSVAAPAGAALVGLALIHAWRTARTQSLFYIGLLSIGTAAVLFSPSHFTHPRYLIICLPFTLILVSQFLVTWTKAGGLKALCALGFGLALLGGNLWAVSEFLKLGRGQTMALMGDILSEESSTHGPILLSAQNDFDVFTVVRYHIPYVQGADRLLLVRKAAAQQPGPGTKWHLRFSFNKVKEPDSEWRDAHGRRHELYASYPYFGVSGRRWTLYQRTIE